MLDADFIRKNLDDVKKNCTDRNVKADVDAVVRLDDRRKQLEFQRGETAAKKNACAALATGGACAPLFDPSTGCLD